MVFDTMSDLIGVQMIERIALKSRLRQLLASFRAVELVGPRQVG